MKNIKATLDKSNEFFNFPTKQDLLNTLKMIFVRARDAFSHDTKIKSISAPVYIFPGVQGYFVDLLTLEKYLWTPLTANIVIMGNIVGPDVEGSIMCFVYLLCLKVLRPDRFNFVRGRYETEQNLQKIFQSFFKNSFDPDLSKILTAICEEIPIAAVIEEQVFVSSGGIPKSMKSLEHIKRTILNSGKVPPDIASDFTTDIWEEIPTEVKPEALAVVHSGIQKSSSDRSKQFARNLTLNQFNHFRHQNGIKSCFLTHYQRKLATTIRMEFDCRLVSLSAPDFTNHKDRIISVALIAYDRIRLFELMTKVDNRKGSAGRSRIISSPGS